MIPKGAGVVVLKTVCNETKFLGLIGPKFLQEKQKECYDTVFGHILKTKHLIQMI